MTLAQVLVIIFATSRLVGAVVAQTATAPDSVPTFNRDIAPIVFSKCVECHHPGGSGPFSLANYAEVRKRAKLVARVTRSGLMPPWLPEPGHGEFAGERRLTGEQIALIERWATAGAMEGDAAGLRVKAEWTDGWRLGKPDLVVTLPDPYTLPAEGKDVYRNFVIPNVVPGDRYLRASEFRPGPTGAIHHAFVLFDDARGARRRDAEDTEAGFSGMDTGGAASPQAMFIAWQPGKGAAEAPPGVAALMRKTTDLVLQLHMRPTGKPEKIQPSVALYFTDQPPTRAALIVLLRSVEIDIPAGAQNYVIESSYQLPVDVDALAVLPHLHFLGKEVRGWAELPDGSRRELIFIKQWDFDWQGDYKYAAPVQLPKGSTLRMRCTYDNSAENPRNPNQPPQRVTYGLQSSDEMGELWLQLIPRAPTDYPVLMQDVTKNLALPDAIAFARVMLRINPNDASRRGDLGAALAMSGRLSEATQELEHAIFDNPDLPRPHYVLGQIAMQQQDARKARRALLKAVKLDPENSRIHNDLGWVLLAMGETDGATEHLSKAVELNPADQLARRNLEKARAKKRGQQ